MWFTLLNIVDVPLLSPATIVERIGGTRVALLSESRSSRLSRSYVTSHLQHAPADSPFLLGSQPHLG